MPVLICYVDDRTYDTLRRFSAMDGRGIEALAEDAIADAAIRSERDLPAPVGRNAERQDPKGLGPKDEHAVTAEGGQAPKPSLPPEG